MVREVALVKSESRVQRNFSYSLTMCLYGMSLSSTIGKWNTLHRSRLELWIPCFDNMVYVGYCLFSSYGILNSIREVLRSLGGGMRRYLHIAQ